MTTPETTTITRTTNENGTYRYESSDGEWIVQSSKVLYTHVSWHALTYEDGTVSGRYVFLTHKTPEAAAKGSYKYGTKVGVREVVAV